MILHEQQQKSLKPAHNNILHKLLFISSYLLTKKKTNLQSLKYSYHRSKTKGKNHTKKLHLLDTLLLFLAARGTFMWERKHKTKKSTQVFLRGKTYFPTLPTVETENNKGMNFKPASLRLTTHTHTGTEQSEQKSGPPPHSGATVANKSTNVFWHRISKNWPSYIAALTSRGCGNARVRRSGALTMHRERRKYRSSLSYETG